MKRLVLVLAACGSSTKPAPVANTTPAPAAKPPVDCAALIDKVLAIAEPDLHPGSEERAKAVASCKEEVAKDPDNPVYGCLRTASDKPTVEKCLADADEREEKKRPERGHGPRVGEAQLQLNKLGKSAKVAFLTNAEYPKGTTTQLPDKPCCGQPSNKCAVTDAWMKDPVWTALDFAIDEPSSFQYSYRSDGKTFHAEAVGDLDCDGIFITYQLDGDASNGNPRYTLTPPPPNSD